MNVYERLRALQIELPGPRPPAAAYVGWVVTGSLLFLSGHTARQRGQPWVGRLGQDMDTAQGQAAARATAIDMLGSLHAALGDLGRIQRLVKLTALVSSDSGFTEHHLVANGASELFVQVLGEKGRHARSAFGVAQTPNASCLELELIADIV
jgi:enamine deaminase RidA (YjgF/YER057c/UK114 family)